MAHISNFKAMSLDSIVIYNERAGTVIGISINTLCSVVGAGMLAIPYALSNGSMIPSIIVLLIVAAASAFSTKILVHCCDMNNRYSYTECVVFTLFPICEVEYEVIQSGEASPLDNSKRKVGIIIMEMISFLTQYGYLIVFTRIIADSVPPILFFIISNQTVMIIFTWIIPAVVFFLLSCSKSMEELKWASAVGFGSIIYVVLVISYRYFVPFTHQYRNFGIRWFEPRTELISSISTFAIAYSYHLNVPYFYNELIIREPEQMMLTVKYAFPLITLCYLCSGVFGYLSFGDAVANSGNIVSSYSISDGLMNLGRIGILFHFALVYPIVSVCARRSIHRFVCLTFGDNTNEKRRLVDGIRPLPGDPIYTGKKSIVIEAFLIVSTCSIIAALAPGIGAILDLFGALSSVPTIFVMPGLIGYYVFADPNAPWLEGCRDSVWLYRYICAAMFVCGILMTIAGMWSAMRNFGMK